MRAFFFIGKNYLKYVLILLVGLEFFFVSADSMKYADHFPDSANLVILFFVYDAMYALNYTLPLSLVLGGILFYITFLKSAQFSAMLALGYSKRKIIAPVLFISLLMTIGYIGLNATPFVYAQEKAEAIVDQNALQNAREDIFVKYNNDYVYFQKVYPLLNKAENIKVFELDGEELKSFVDAKTAFFDGDYWILHDVNVVKIKDEFIKNQNFLETSHIARLKILKNFRPKVLDTFSKDKPTVSIVDAIVSAKILISQKIDFEKVRAILYSFIVIPFFVPLTLIIVAYFVPPLARYANIPLMSFGFVILSLILWGIFFSVSKLSVSGIIYPEFGILIPMGILTIFALYALVRINQA
ncbi:LptF/LptG family permease [Helicobacter pametensis]|uniref:LptF/LptG family permease n=1 Tax=Helicobacter pametensis TaxID=95149 RepID=UPI0004838E04|nr:LptF/LptG family permease [Helicobacter pametensis]